MGEYCFVKLFFQLYILICMYEVGHGVKRISCYKSQTKKLKITALDVNSIAFQNIIGIHCCGVVNTVRLPKQYLQPHVPSLTEEVCCLAMYTSREQPRM